MSRRPLTSELAVDPARAFASHCGLEFVELTAERVVGAVPVRDEIRQPMGIVDGGLYAAVAESMASYATALGVYEDGKIAVGLSNHTSFFRPIFEGTVHAKGRPLHRGRTTWVWEIEHCDDDGRLCALSRVTVAVRDPITG